MEQDSLRSEGQITFEKRSSLTFPGILLAIHIILFLKMRFASTYPSIHLIGSSNFTSAFIKEEAILWYLALVAP